PLAGRDDDGRRVEDRTPRGHSRTMDLAAERACPHLRPDDEVEAIAHRNPRGMLAARVVRHGNQSEQPSIRRETSALYAAETVPSPAPVFPDEEVTRAVPGDRGRAPVAAGNLKDGELPGIEHFPVGRDTCTPEVSAVPAVVPDHEKRRAIPVHR